MQICRKESILLFYYYYSKEKEEQRTKDRKEGYLTARIFNC